MPLQHSLPTTLNFSVPSITSKAMLDVFDAAGLRVSAGSACSAAKSAPSYVLDAMGLPAWRTTSAVRLSIGSLTSAQMVEAACQAIARCGQILLAMRSEEDDATTPDGVLVEESCSAEDATAMTLYWNELDAFLSTHPHARLVDVREAAEHQASCGIQYGALTAVSLPLSAIATLPPAWTESPLAPVVLVCRSGKRSLKAAQWLRSQGHAHVRHLHGGLALRPDVAPAAQDLVASGVSA